EAAWPEGNEVDAGIGTRRARCRPDSARAGRCLWYRVFRPRLTVAEATPMDTMPSTAARRPPPPPPAGAGEPARAPQPQARMVGRLGDPANRAVEVGGGRPGDGLVDGSVD